MLRVKVVAWFVKSIHVCFLEGRMTFFFHIRYTEELEKWLRG